METKFSAVIKAGFPGDQKYAVEVDTFLWFGEIFLEVIGDSGTCITLTTEQAEEIGNALLSAVEFRREGNVDHG